MARKPIDESLALAIAGQVSIGIMSGERQAERSHMALVVIGMMLKGAAKTDAVDEILALGERSRVRALEGGGWSTEEKTEIIEPSKRP